MKSFNLKWINKEDFSAFNFKTNIVHNTKESRDGFWGALKNIQIGIQCTLKEEPWMWEKKGLLIKCCIFLLINVVELFNI